MTTTPILVVDPVVGTAVANDLTRLFSVGVLDLTCPTCGGRGLVTATPGPTSGLHLHGDQLVPCTARCTGGQVTLPTDILIAAANGEIMRREGRRKLGRWVVTPPPTEARMDGVTRPWSMFDPTVNGSRADIHPAHILGTIHGVKALPIHRFDDPATDDLPDGARIIVIGNDGNLAMQLNGRYIRLTPDALPWGPWTPGATAIRFDRFEASVPCPDCDGAGMHGDDDTGGGWFEDCETCDGSLGSSRLLCPISWPGSPATPGLHHIDLGEAVA